MKTTFLFFLQILFLLTGCFELTFTQTVWITFNSSNSPLDVNNILTLKHDKKNNIWIGTTSGLYKFDGAFWKKYNKQNSDLPSNNVSTLVIDPENNLWFMVNKNNYPYFIKFDGINWVRTDTSNTCLEWCYYDDFAVDKDEVKWVAGKKIGEGEGIIRVSEGTCTRYITEIAWYNAKDFTIDQNNHFWFSADWTEGYTGIAKFNNSQWQYQHSWSVGLAIDTVFSEAWYSAVSSLKKINFNNLNLISWYNTPEIDYMVPDQNYNLWCKSLSSNGIIKFNRLSTSYTQFQKSNSELPSDSVNSIVVDDSNNIWIATNYGLTLYNELGIKQLPSISNKDTIHFDNVPLNDTLSLDFRITNNLLYNIIIDSVIINSSEFSIIKQFPVIIHPDSNKQFLISFSPELIGIYENRMLIYTNLGIKCIFLSGVGENPSSIQISEEKKLSYKLSQNYPNPFNPSTSIQYAISSRQFVTLKVYDVIGNEVAILVSEEKPAGNYEVSFDASKLSSGVYYYQLRSGEFIRTKKMIYLK